MKKYLFFLLLAFMAVGASGTARHIYYLRVADSVLVGVDTPAAGQVRPLFTVAGINTIIAQFHYTDFSKLDPNSRFKDMRQVYRMVCDSAAVPTQLIAAYPQYFLGYSETYDNQMCGTPYYPNDYHLNNDGYMDYINMPDAWGITHGDSNIVIGISDICFDTTHKDLKGKVVGLAYNNLYATHGTFVAGIAAGATNNDYAMPGIGFNCRLDLDGSLSIEGLKRLAEIGHRRIVNGSFIGVTSPTLSAGDFSQQREMDEIYEDGTFAVIAAGNGAFQDSPYPAWYYGFPASYNHAFCVSNVGWENPYGGSNTTNQQGIHEKWYGDTVNTQGHNDQVDLLSPSINIGGIICCQPDTSIHYTTTSGYDGTSFGSPTVAGVAGLMLSVNSCLTPYQLEYILKTSANSTILTLPENLKFQGRLGAGALQADVAVADAQLLDCNDPLTQTFYIKGIELNGLCKPGKATNGFKPVMKVVTENGAGNPANYKYLWQAIDNTNTTTLSSYTSMTPTIDSSWGANLAYYYLTVYDSSAIQKVANKVIRIQLDTANKPDLAMRDAYVDMFDQPNTQMTVDPREWDIWNSPDIWNRNDSDGIEEHQNPAWSATTTDSNYMYVRVHNIGCITSVNSWLYLFWTLASSGEHYLADWTGANFVQGSSGLVPTGGSIVFDTSLKVPLLPPGDDVILKKAWRMPYGIHSVDTTATTLAVCALARVFETGKTNGGLAFPTSANTSNNVDSNNNIATRNMVAVTLANQSPWKMAETIPILTGNPFGSTKTFTLQLLHDKDIYKHFAGNLSQYIYGTLKLPSGLWHRWYNAGHYGNYAAFDSTTCTVTYDPASPLRLDSIQITSDEHFLCSLTLQLRGKVPNDVAPGIIHFRQLLQEAKQETVTGSVAITVNFQKDGDVKGKRQSLPVTTGIAARFIVYPNPVSNTLTIGFNGPATETATIKVTDITGKIFTRKEGLAFSVGVLQQLDVSKLIPGIYIVHITTGTGTEESYKINKK